MKARTRLAIAAVALAVSVGGSVAAVATSGSAQPQGKAHAKAMLALPIDTSTEAKFTAIAPCRIVDTRITGGPIHTGSPRSFLAAGSSSLAAQGGNPLGCGVPSAAVAVQANVVTVGASGSGYLKIYPYGAAAPGASYMNYPNGSALANGGTITLNTAGLKHFTVLAASHDTHVVIDVSGYFIKPMFAQVNSDGSLGVHSRTTGSTQITSFPGAYEVDFDRDVSGCAYNATPFDQGYTAIVEPRSGNVDGVFVYTSNSSGTPTNEAFYLTVTC
jgi:hypothetical protein